PDWPLRTLPSPLTEWPLNDWPLNDWPLRPLPVDNSESEVLEKAKGKSPISAFFLRSKSKSKVQEEGTSQGCSPSQ
ncbi:hypothetical protein Tco_0398554, partial [Tanacetum coccineum]